MKYKKYLVKPGRNIELKDFDPNDTSEFDDKKKEGQKAFLKINKEIEALQELLFAEGKQRLLVILQAMDTGGKDGVIRKVFEGVNPQGVRVAPFKTPSILEIGRAHV